MMYFLAAAAASGVFIAAGWRSKHSRSFIATQSRHSIPIDPVWNGAQIDINAPEPQADVGDAFRLIMKRLAPVMARRSVQLEIACPSGLLVRMRSVTLTDLLEEFLTASIHSAPTSRILMTGAARGDSIYVSITDDMLGADPSVRLGSVRGLMGRVAMHGGVLDVNVRPLEGTTMTLRLAAEINKDRVSPGAVVRSPDSIHELPIRAEW